MGGQHFPKQLSNDLRWVAEGSTPEGGEDQGVALGAHPGRDDELDLRTHGFFDSAVLVEQLPREPWATWSGTCDHRHLEGLAQIRVAIRLGPSKNRHAVGEQASILWDGVELSPLVVREPHRIAAPVKVLLLRTAAGSETAAGVAGVGHVEHTDSASPSTQLPCDLKDVTADDANFRQL
jgi:hypothetical protein